jgi:hypothetical protein
VVKTETQIFETKEQIEWQLKKVERSQRKKVARRAVRRKAGRRQPRRDSSDLDGRTATLNLAHTNFYRPAGPFKRNDEHFKRISSFLLYFSFEFLAFEGSSANCNLFSQ